MRETVGCTVTKRKHLKGYSIQWKSHYASGNDQTHRDQEIQKNNTINNSLEFQNEDTPVRSSIVNSNKNIADSSLSGQAREEQVDIHRQYFLKTTTANVVKKKAEPIINNHSVSPPYVDDEGFERMKKAGWIIMGVGVFFFLCILFAYSTVGYSNSVFGIILQILMGLLGLLLINIFGVFSALIFATIILIGGLVMVGVAHFTLLRRKRFQDKEP